MRSSSFLLANSVGPREPLPTQQPFHTLAEEEVQTGDRAGTPAAVPTSRPAGTGVRALIGGSGTKQRVTPAEGTINPIRAEPEGAAASGRS